MSEELFFPVMSAADFEQMIKNYNRITPPYKADFAAADALLADQAEDGSFKSVEYADDTRGWWKGFSHWDKLHTIVGAWHGSHELKYRDAVIAGLDFWGREMPENPNWWWQFVGVPVNIIRVINNMYGEIPPETLENLRECFNLSDIVSVRNLTPDWKFKPVPEVLSDRISMFNVKRFYADVFKDAEIYKFTGQNLVATGVIRMWKGIFYNEVELFRSGITEVLSEVVIAKRGLESLQPDYSFHQHGPQQQFGNYGREYYVNIRHFLALFKGTAFTPPEEKSRIIRDYFLNGLQWTLYKKQMDILACGRQFIKDYTFEKYSTLEEVIASCGEPEEQKFFTGDNELSGSSYFYCSDYFIHRRKNCYFSFKMCSSRVASSESTNMENLFGLYLGCGTMQYKITGDEYDRISALWDWHRLPGLTAVYDDDSLRCRGFVNQAAAVGGVSDRENSGVMLHFDFEKLSYYKSVAVFDRKVVFNLSHVVNKTSAPVNTTVDSKCYSAPVKVTANGKTVEYTDGVHQLSGVSRIVCGETAYHFQGAELTLAIEEKTVPWSVINSWADGSHSGKMVTIYFTGEKQLNYTVTPAAETFEAADSMILPGGIHAVRDEKSNISYIFFFNPGEADIPGTGKVSCDSKAAVMIKKDQIILADAEQKNIRVGTETWPTQAKSCEAAAGNRINFTLDGKVYTFTAADGKSLEQVK